MQSQFPPDEDSILISPREARSISGGISESTQRRLIEAGEYPATVALSHTKSGRAARIAFVKSEVVAWCRNRIAAHRTPSTPPEAAA